MRAGGQRLPPLFFAVLMLVLFVLLVAHILAEERHAGARGAFRGGAERAPSFAELPPSGGGGEGTPRGGILQYLVAAAPPSASRTGG